MDKLDQALSMAYTFGVRVERQRVASGAPEDIDVLRDIASGVVKLSQSEAALAPGETVFGKIRHAVALETLAELDREYAINLLRLHEESQKRISARITQESAR